MQTKLIEAPGSDANQEITELGYVDAYDAVNNDDYAFVAYKELDRSSGQWRVRIKGKGMTGVVFEPEAMRLQARAAGAQGKPYFTWGNGIEPSAGDGRCIQYRVHVSGGKLSEIEIFVQTRNADGTGGVPVTARFAWPV
jgi:hypothetical protein